MAEKIVKGIIGALGSLVSIPFMKEIIVFIISLCPILELRGGLIAAALLKMNPVESYIICIIGNLLPVPFILWLMKRILTAMQNSKIKIFNKFAISRSAHVSLSVITFFTAYGTNEHISKSTP